MPVSSKAAQPATDPNPRSDAKKAQAVAAASEPNLPKDPKFQRAKDAIAKGDYDRALQLLSVDSRHLENLNCRAVCLIRLGRFKQAIDVLRSSVIQSGTLTVRPEVPDHMAINFAIALFYGGTPSGALDVLDEIRREDDPAVKQLRQATAQWVAGMSWLRRLDWRLNRIEPKQGPPVPAHPLGRFRWEERFPHQPTTR